MLWVYKYIFYLFYPKLLIMSSIFDSVGWTPSFLLKRYVLTGIHGGLHEPFIADSVDFVVAQVKVLHEPVQTLLLLLVVAS